MDETNEYPILMAPYTEDGCLSELDRALDFLNKLKDPALIVEGEHGFKPIKSVFYVVSLKLFSELSNQDSLFESNSGFEIIASILEYLASKLDELDFKTCGINYRWLTNDIKTTNNERRIFILMDLISIINFLIPVSMKLRLFLLDKKRLKTFIEIINNENFLKNGTAYDFQLIKSIIFDINWISKSAENNKSDWKELNAIPSLLNCLKVTNKLNLYIYMVVANLADDKEIENLTEIQASIDTFVGLTNQISVHLLNGTGQKFKQQFTDDEDDKKILSYEVLCILDENINATISVTGLLVAIYRLSINPKSKLNIYNKTNFKKSLKTLLSLGSEIEKLYAIELIGQLIFDAEVLNDLINDKELCEVIRQITNEKELKIEKLRKISKQILWSIEENEKKKLTIINVEEEKKTKENGHIMISYNTGSRDLCLKIKEELERDNHKIWIDVNEIHGSSLDSMARAVENSKCVLMCVTEKYRQSLNCQAEAQYAFRLNKNIIPCIMQKGYHNVDGWLGFIIGDKIFIDFSKYSLEDSIKRLKNQINLITNDKKAVSLKTQPTSSPITQACNVATSTITNFETTTAIDSKFVQLVINSNGSNKKSENVYDKINKWTEREVDDWFNAVNMANTFIHKTLFPCNGELLSQLHQIQLHAPEFFFKSISNDTNLNDLKTVALFSIELKKLF